MTTSFLKFCRDPKLSHWGLGPPCRSGVLDLIGWHIEPTPIDGGAPPEVAQLLATAMTKVCRLTYQTSAPLGTGGTVEGDVVKEVSSGLLDTLRRRRFVRVSTRSASTAVSLFEDAEYPWWSGVQAALLSDRDAPPPSNLSIEGWHALLGDDWTDRASDLMQSGVLAVLRAGVDGDVAGVWSRDRTVADALLTSLEAEARKAGFEYVELDEADF